MKTEVKGKTQVVEFTTVRVDPELSAEFLKRKIGNLEKTEVPTLVSADTGCIMHIAGGLHRQEKPQRVIHIAEVLNHR